MYRNVPKPVFGLALLVLGGCTTGDFHEGLLATQKASAYVQGKKAFQARNYGLAVKNFTSALNQDPNSVDSLNGLAAAYDMLGRYDLSYRLYNSALRYRPHATETLNNLGYSHLLQRKPDVAMAFLREALSSGEKYPQIASNLQLARLGLERSRQVVRANQSSADAKTTKVDNSRPALRKTRPRRGLRIVRSGPGENVIITAVGQANKDDDVGPIRRQVQPDVNQSQRERGKIDEEALPPARAEARPSMTVAYIYSTRPRSSLDIPNDWFLEATLKLSSVPSITVEISNGTGRRKMAARMRRYLKSDAIHKVWLSNANNFNKTVTTLFFKPGTRKAASDLAKRLPGSVRMIQRSNQRAELHLELGADLLKFDTKLIGAKTSRGENA